MEDGADTGRGVLVRREEDRPSETMPWGLVSGWPKAVKIGNRAVNARIEAAFRKPAKLAFSKNRIASKHFKANAGVPAADPGR